MPTHTVSGITIQVDPIERNYFFFRQQGVSVRTPRRRSAFITCGFTPRGRRQLDGRCSNCDALEVWAPGRWGFGVRRLFADATYVVTVAGTDPSDPLIRGTVTY